MSTVKMVMANKTNKQALEDWEDLVQNIRSSSSVNINETEAEKRARKKKLEKDREAWMKYYFENDYKSAPAKFHIESSNKFLSEKWIYHSRKWARGLSKSTRRMMEIMYKMLAQGTRLNMLLISKSGENATTLLMPYRANLEHNARIINDYGMQVGSRWKEEDFRTRGKSAFRAVGAQQNPRGTKNESMRPNMIVFDDVDDDEVCRNTDRLEERWAWIEKAVIFTVDVSEPYWICFDNNIIAEDSIAVRAAEKATFSETVNIRDENGKSSWPEKNSEEHIDYLLGLVSYESGQSEYFNNPMSQGRTFPAMTWGKCPAISSLDFIQIYSDPSTSNNDKPTMKSKALNSHKAVFVIGSDGTNFYVYTGFVDQCSNSIFIDWKYAAWDYAKRHNAKAIFIHIENNTLQNPFYEQALLPLVFARAKELQSNVLPISPDVRVKPEKWIRIEATLEPLNRTGRLILNEKEKSNPHMTRLEAQFKSAKPTSKRLDGPDCIEGGVFLIQQRFSIKATGGITMIRRPINPKRY